MLRTGICNSLYRLPGKPFADYEKMALHGYACADFQGLCDTKGALYLADEKEFCTVLTAERERAAASGITLSQVHAPWPVTDTTEEERAQNLEWMKTAVRGTKILGSPYLVVHPQMPYGWAEEQDPDFAYRINYDFFSSLCDYAQDFGVNICVENMPTKKHKLARVPALLDLIRDVGRKNFFLCLDTGHCNVSGDDCGDMVRLCGDLLRVLHVHDNFGDYDRHLFPYYGTIDWESFRKSLGETGFTGVLSIEANLKTAKVPGEAIEHMMKGLAAIAHTLAV